MASYIRKNGKLYKKPESVYVQPVVKKKPPVVAVKKSSKKKKGAK